MTRRRSPYAGVGEKVGAGETAPGMCGVDYADQSSATGSSRHRKMP
ncbi:MAG: hypothetical protein PHV80_09500 [Rugosibacter sp.]|nr:hypothetical protein [Rugosibacter sp.]